MNNISKNQMSNISQNQMSNINTNTFRVVCAKSIYFSGIQEKLNETLEIIQATNKIMSVSSLNVIQKPGGIRDGFTDGAYYACICVKYNNNPENRN